MASELKQLNVRLDRIQMKKFQLIAAREDKSMTEMVRIMVDQLIEDQEPQARKLLESMTK